MLGYHTNKCSGDSAAAAAVDQVLAAAGGLDEEILALIGLRKQVDAVLVKRVGAFDTAEQYKDDSRRVVGW